MGSCVVLPANVTSAPVTALFNVTETEIFYRRYLKINNSTVKEYFLKKFSVFSEIYSESSARNFVGMRSDLAFLSNIVCDLLFQQTV